MLAVASEKMKWRIRHLNCKVLSMEEMWGLYFIGKIPKIDVLCRFEYNYIN